MAAVVGEELRPIKIPQPIELLSPPIIALEHVSVGYEPKHPLLRRLSLRVDDDDRIALLGANGNGKSTLMKLIAGRLAPLSGRMSRAQKLEIGYFAQHQLDELCATDSAYIHLRRLMPQESEAKVRARAGLIGFPGELAETPVGELSGGEKTRLLIGLATLSGPHLLILDEPTNHLDIDSRSALIAALNAYRGAVILVSHDRHLVEACADRLWLVADGQVTPFDGDLDDYRARILADGETPANEQRRKQGRHAARRTRGGATGRGRKTRRTCSAPAAYCRCGSSGRTC